MKKLSAASVLFAAAISGTPAFATPVQMECIVDAPATYPVAVWLPAGSMCYVNGMEPIYQEPVREPMPVGGVLGLAAGVLGVGLGVLTGAVPDYYAPDYYAQGYYTPDYYTPGYYSQEWPQAGGGWHDGGHNSGGGWHGGSGGHWGGGGNGSGRHR